MRVSTAANSLSGLTDTLLDTAYATGDGSTTTVKARSQDAGSNSTRHDSEAEQVEPKNFTVRAGGADNERTTRHACQKRADAP